MEINTQRNTNDVIMELLKQHIESAYAEGNPVSSEDIEKVFLKYVYLVTNARNLAEKQEGK